MMTRVLVTITREDGKTVLERFCVPLGPPDPDADETTLPDISMAKRLRRHIDQWFGTEEEED